jgi:hypothetical protein
VPTAGEELERFLTVLGGIDVESVNAKLMHEHPPIDRVALGEEYDASFALGHVPTLAGSATGRGRVRHSVVPSPAVLCMRTPSSAWRTVLSKMQLLMWIELYISLANDAPRGTHAVETTCGGDISTAHPWMAPGWGLVTFQ